MDENDWLILVSGFGEYDIESISNNSITVTSFKEGFRHGHIGCISRVWNQSEGGKFNWIDVKYQLCV